jgi:hypothetical protein
MSGRCQNKFEVQRLWEFAAAYYDVPAIDQTLLVRMRNEPGVTCFGFS